MKHDEIYFFLLLVLSIVLFFYGVSHVPEDVLKSINEVVVKS